MTSHTPGERLFSRYAYSPNELGYCGPAGAELLAAVARGENVDGDVRPIAAQFSGAWIYQVVIGKMAGRDPLDAEVVRGYWTGNSLTASVDAGEFWQHMLAILGPRAGAYWKYLDDSLAPEATPHHAFHVLGVYPWTRLLKTGRPEPVHVLQSCCIRPARVIAAGPDGLSVEHEEFVYRDGALTTETTVDEGVAALFDPDVAVGDTVALHWGSACDVLSAAEASTLTDQLGDQLDRLNRRLARD